MARIGIEKLVPHVGCGSVDDVAACVLCDQIRARLRSAARREELIAALEVPLAYWRTYFASQGGPHWSVQDEFWRQWLDAYGHLVPESPEAADAVDPHVGVSTDGPRAHASDALSAESRLTLLQQEWYANERELRFRCYKAEKALTLLQQERDRLAEALRTYGRHKPDCAAHKCRVCGKSSEWMTHPPSFADSVHRFEPADCTCGFSALLASSGGE